MSDRTFLLRHAMPIPVGHRVELCVFALRTSPFSGPKPQPYDALVTDLDTGIVYGQIWHFIAGDSSNAVGVPLAVRQDLHLVERVQGRVLATRLMYAKLPDAGDSEPVTTLVVALAT